MTILALILMCCGLGALLQFSTTVRAARADATETAIGVSPFLEIRTGAQPANCAAASTGTVLATMALPSDFLTNPGTGVKAILGTWSDNAADAAGVAAHFRIFANDHTTCHVQGDVTITGGGGKMEIDNTNIAVGQVVTVTAFTLTDGNS